MPDIYVLRVTFTILFTYNNMQLSAMLSHTYIHTCSIVYVPLRLLLLPNTEPPKTSEKKTKKQKNKKNKYETCLGPQPKNNCPL